MAKILNTTMKPYYMGIQYKDIMGNVKLKSLTFIPGERKDISAEDLKELRAQKGFVRFEKANELVVTDDAEETIIDAVEVSDAAKKLAEEHGINLASLSPNADGKITVNIVRDAVKASSDDL